MRKESDTIKGRCSWVVRELPEDFGPPLEDMKVFLSTDMRNQKLETSLSPPASVITVQVIPEVSRAYGPTGNVGPTVDDASVLAMIRPSMACR